MTREKRKQNDLEREEFGSDMSPDDLDLREYNDQTKEQVNNSNEENKHNEKKNKA